MKTSLALLFGLLACIPARAEFYFFSTFTASGYPYISAAGINKGGDIVGTAYDSGSRPVAYRYASGTFYTDASPGPSHSTWGDAINTAGTIVGFCDRTGHPLGNVYHAFYANAGGSSTDFDSNFTRNSEAKAIIDSGYVVGSLSPSSTLTPAQSFLGHTSGWIMPLGSTLGNSFAAVGLNDSLVVVGNGPWGAETYNALTGAITYLGYALGSWSSTAAAINHSGTVAGKLGSQGFLDTAGAVTLFGSNISEVKAMNASGDAVGALSNGHAFVYVHSNGHFLDLNTCVASSITATWTLVSATGINDSGSICGSARRLATPAEYSTYGTYVYQPYRLNPFFIIFTPGPLIPIALTQ